MNSYKVALTRTYLVSINAENEDQAKRFSEYCLGDCNDLSNKKERLEKNFSFEEIEMVNNEANEILSITD